MTMVVSGAVGTAGDGAQFQGGASCLLEARLNENSVLGRLQTTGRRKGRTGSVNAATVQFVKLAVQPILILGRRLSWYDLLCCGVRANRITVAAGELVSAPLLVVRTMPFLTFRNLKRR